MQYLTVAQIDTHDYLNPSLVKGLVLWASYPASGNDLSKTSIAVVTIHGTNDGLVTASQIDDSLQRLPPDTDRVEITGGNHAQFGYYGKQSGDGEATISRQSQKDQTAAATIRLLRRISAQ